MSVGKIFAAIVGLATIASAFWTFQSYSRDNEIILADSVSAGSCDIVFVEQGDGSFIRECLSENAGAAFADKDGASGSNPRGAYQVEIDRNGGCAARSDSNNENTVNCTYRDN
ncbi:MAG: hypothetical protein ABJZ83_05255 [Yoonia sp.]|uniref:hypothetical protein n=1 Tax=Yoonia sp. TaxID=2212373 RepID=UPI003265C121